MSASAVGCASAALASAMIFATGLGKQVADGFVVEDTIRQSYLILSEKITEENDEIRFVYLIYEAPGVTRLV
jgi:hypothetical protein